MPNIHPRTELRKLLPADPATRRRTIRVALAMSLLAAVYLAWLISGWPHQSRDAVGGALFVPLSIGAVWASWAASRRCASAARLRWAWRLVALASLSYLGGSIA